MAEDIVNASNTFAFELAKRARIPGNFALSPASISAALVMAWSGASGKTAAEMKDVLHLGKLDPAMTAWGQLSNKLQDPTRELVLGIANRLFGERSFAFETTFLDKLQATFGAPLEAVDFATNAEAARVRINAWVAEQTKQRITNLLPARSLTELTRLVLVNAIYFLADWESPFAVHATHDAAFTTPREQVMVPTMHTLVEYRHAKLDHMSMLELPYKGDAAMLVVLPDRADGLAQIEAQLDAKRLARWQAALRSERVAVALPRFVVDPALPIELASVLSALGMPSAFDPELADFSGMATSSDRAELCMSNVIHKAFVKVDEKGTEAAAATAVVMVGRGGAPRPAAMFTADHPFLFLIVDQASGLILFLGRVEDPR